MRRALWGLSGGRCRGDGRSPAAGTLRAGTTDRIAGRSRVQDRCSGAPTKAIFQSIEADGPCRFVAGAGPASSIVSCGSRTARLPHDVSILITPGDGDARCLGILPGSNVSMTCMRPPQHGQDVGSTRGSSAAGLAGSGLGGGGDTASSSRARAMASARLPLANRP